MVSAAAPLAAKSTGSTPTACTASVCSGMPCRAATSASSRMGLTVPTSLFAHITLTRATSSGFSAIAAASVSACTLPKPSTSSQLTRAPSWSASHCAASCTAWCSTADISTRRRARSAPLLAQ